MDKCYGGLPRVEEQQRQRHLLSKRTRVSAVKEDLNDEKPKPDGVVKLKDGKTN